MAEGEGQEVTRGCNVCLVGRADEGEGVDDEGEVEMSEVGVGSERTTKRSRARPEVQRRRGK